MSSAWWLRNIKATSKASSWDFVVATSTALGATATFAFVAYSSTTKSSLDWEHSKNKDPSFQIEINFMDKLANKPYFSSAALEPNNKDKKQLYRDNQVDEPISTSRRSALVPRTLRILAVDLPDVRRGFRGGECRLASDKVYPDFVASPKVLAVDPHTGKRISPVNKSAEILEIDQKAWVKSLYQCYQEGDANNVGVQIMEADTAALNVHNLKRMISLNRRPTNAILDPNDDQSQRKSNSGKKKKKKGNSVEDEDADSSTSKTKVLTDIPLEKELDAPWNQYAWAEEMILRVQGRVGFGETMQPPGRWERYFFGSTYKTTIPSSRSSGDGWFGGRILNPIYWFFGGIRSSDIAGFDGAENGMNWASQKPHAVIANGASLHRVPHSLRLLQRMCREADVPLFVIRDPRSWGGNTHQDDLGQVLRDVRQVVKERIIQASLHEATGTAFSRGRWVGKFEANATWQAKTSLRAAQDALRQAEESQRWKREMDWKNLGAKELEEKLVSRGVITRTAATGNEGDDVVMYGKALQQLAQKCLDCVPTDKESPSAALAKDAETAATAESASIGMK